MAAEDNDKERSVGSVWRVLGGYRMGGWWWESAQLGNLHLERERKHTQRFLQLPTTKRVPPRRKKTRP